MTQKNERNRPVFRPQSEDLETTATFSGDAGEGTPRVEEEEATPTPGYEPTQDEWADQKKGAAGLQREKKPSARVAKAAGEGEAEQPPATVAPAHRSAFARTGNETRGRMKSLPDPAEGGDKPKRAASAAAEKRSPEAGAASPAGGDTVPVMKSVDYDPAKARRAQRGPVRPTGKPAQLPRPRRHTTAPVRFGFFGFLFGLIGLVVRMLIVTVLVGGIVGFASYWIIQTYVKTPQVLVPSVRGMSVQQAFETLSKTNLPMVQERAEPSPLVPPGEVIEQRPAPGIWTKEGTTVRLVVSSGRSNFVVPDVRGETRDTAIGKIKGAQLEVGNVTFLPDDKVPADVVITQNPEANKGLDQPSKVDLLISSGPPGKPLTMPEVTGVTVQEAQARLSRLGVSDVRVEPANVAADALVTGQDPLVGKTIFQSQQVILQARK